MGRSLHLLVPETTRCRLNFDKVFLGQDLSAVGVSVLGDCPRGADDTHQVTDPVFDRLTPETRGGGQWDEVNAPVDSVKW